MRARVGYCDHMRSLHGPTTLKYPRWTGFLAVIARGAALFLGLFSLANTIAAWRNPSLAEDLWWIDLRFLHPVLALLVGVAAAALLVALGLAPSMSRGRRSATAAACGLLALVALQNALVFWRLMLQDAFTPAVPVPLSALIALLLGVLGLFAVRSESPRTTVGSAIGIAISMLCWMALFPLAQVAFFGTTDYRAAADTAVVLGARAYVGGALSQSLDDRVVTAVELYQTGLVRRLVMSGGVDDRGVDEAEQMGIRAMRLGVPSEAIHLDHLGVNSDATVRNTSRLFRAEKIESVLVVSQFYHLPRLKMAYRAAGWDVRTVPAVTRRPIVGTPFYVAREIPGFWVYWARAWWRSVGG